MRFQGGAVQLSRKSVDHGREHRYDSGMTALLLTAWLATALPHVQADPLAAVPRISVADLKKLVDRQAVLVLDVRDAGSYAAGHLPGAILVPLESLEQDLAMLRREKRPIVTYCS
jgi:3-mercaptopyruvate sulfurtransferase SseA